MVRPLDYDASLGSLPCATERGSKALGLNPAIVEPVGAPYPVEAPSEMLQDILSQAITLASP
jgi:hypothetical protein